jgi:hypothetical protein
MHQLFFAAVRHGETWWWEDNVEEASGKLMDELEADQVRVRFPK